MLSLIACYGWNVLGVEQLAMLIAESLVDAFNVLDGGPYQISNDLNDVERQLVLWFRRQIGVHPWTFQGSGVAIYLILTAFFNISSLFSSPFGWRMPIKWLSCFQDWFCYNLLAFRQALWVNAH